MGVRLPFATGHVVGSVAGMGVQARRRLDLLLLVVVGLVVGSAAAAGAAVGDGERVTGLWAGAEFVGDGSARVVEVVDYDFGVLRRHGIFRDVPGLPPDAQVTAASVSAPDDVELTSMGADTRIRIGDPARTISGRHRYRIQYALEDVALGGRLAWDAVGTGWRVGIGAVRVDVVAPFEFQAVRCVQGEVGSQAPCEVVQPEPGHLVAKTGALPAGQGATLYATSGRELPRAPGLPVPSAGGPADATSGVPVAGLLAGAVALVGAGLASRLVRRAGRERVPLGGTAAVALADRAGTDGEIRVDAAELASLASIEFTPPAELTPAQGGVLLVEAVQEQHKLAWLISAAADGYIDLQGDGQEVTLVCLAGQDRSPTARILNRAFAGRQRLTLGSYDPSFAGAWSEIAEELATWHRTSGLWDPAGDLRQRLVRMLGGVAAVGGLAVAALGGAAANRWGRGWLAVLAWGALLAGVGLAAVVRAWELRVRTPMGSGLWLRVESFRRFLAGSEAHHAEEAAKRGVLGEYTAWAVAFGEDDRWSRAVAASTVPPKTAHYPLMARRLPSAMSTTTTAPQSSGSGGGSGGGGGGVGGGSGGGGGGSW